MLSWHNRRRCRKRLTRGLTTAGIASSVGISGSPVREQSVPSPPIARSAARSFGTTPRTSRSAAAREKKKSPDEDHDQGRRTARAGVALPPSSDRGRPARCGEGRSRQNTGRREARHGAPVPSVSLLQNHQSMTPGCGRLWAAHSSAVHGVHALLPLPPSRLQETSPGTPRTPVQASMTHDVNPAIRHPLRFRIRCEHPALTTAAEDISHVPPRSARAAPARTRRCRPAAVALVRG